MSKIGTSKKEISSKRLEKCEETMCTKFVKKGVKLTKEFMTDVIKIAKKGLEHPDLEKRKRAKKSLKALLIAKKKMSRPSFLNNNLNKSMQMCKKLYCNPSCAKTNVKGVEDGFNKELDPKAVKKLKREGAISGCIHDKW